MPRARIARWIACLLGVLLASAASGQGVRTLHGRTEGGAYYSIAVPEAWRAGDGLVLVNHGYRLDPLDPEPSLGPSPLRRRWLEQGLAIAASSYRQRGWALFFTREDHRELIRAFSAQFGTPGAVYAVGGSLGGLVALQQAEQDDLGASVVGVYALCPVFAGARVWDTALDARLIYDRVCANVTLGELPGGDPGFPWLLSRSRVLDRPSEETLAQTALALARCTGLGLNDVLVSSGMRERRARLGRLLGASDDFLPTLVWYATFGLSDTVWDPEKLDGGVGVHNLGVDYGEATLDAGIRRITPDPLARLMLLANDTPSGRIGAARVLSLHTSGDDLVAPEQQSTLDGVLPAAQWRRALVREVDGSHCGFTEPELLAGWSALYDWTRGAAAPGPAELIARCRSAGAAPGECRFDPDGRFAPVETRLRPRPRLWADAGSWIGGLWFDPERAGEGFVVEALDAERALVLWFTYDHHGDQTWFLGVGRRVAHGVAVERLIRAEGGRWGEAFRPEAVRRLAQGALYLAFTACDRAVAGWRWPGPEGRGRRELRILSRLAGRSCSDAAVANTGPWSAESGSYIPGPDRSGEGLVLHVAADGRAVLFWFGFDPNGAPLWLVGDGQAVDDRIVFDGMLRPRGARFGSAFRPEEVEYPRWGTMLLERAGDGRLHLHLQPLDPRWDGGRRTLIRLTTPL